MTVASAILTAGPCAECHREIETRQTQSHHSQALRRILDTPFASLLRKNPIEEAGVVKYSYDPAEGGLAVTTQRDNDSFRALLEWTFGAGAVGHTAVGRIDGRYFEHRISYYAEMGRSSLTPGQPFDTPRNARDALGQVQSPEDAFRCFNCHATGVVKTDAGPDLGKAAPGIQCERCHGPGDRHIAAAKTNPTGSEVLRTVLNPGRLAARAVVEYCGECHRAPKAGQISTTPELEDALSVRYQPFGLMASRCFVESKKLSCLTCHDPHEDAHRRDNGFYDAKCASCHQATVKPGAHCRRNQKQDCLPCHMQRTSPMPYLTFTDHRIRVY